MNEPEKRTSSLRPVLLIWLVMPLLLWWAIKNVPFKDVWTTLYTLHVWQMALWLAVNVIIVLMFTGRWWIILKSIWRSVPFTSMVMYRLAGFGISYFTPGPQFGGEPAQVLFIQRRHQVPLPEAASSVFLDKSLEFLANFTFLALGLMTIITHNVAKESIAAWFWVPVLGLLSFPTGHLTLLWRGKKPAYWILSGLAKYFPRSTILLKTADIVQKVEEHIITLCREQPGILVGGMLLSALVWGMMIAEYFLLLRFIGLRLDLAHTIIALTAARLAFLLPLPGGLGVLEASQVLVMEMLGFSPAAGISISLLIRARDILFGGMGLWLGSWASTH